MLSGLIILHVVICILLTITVLVQFGKGAEAGAMMGGGSSQAVFTSSSKGNFFTKMTTFLAIIFGMTGAGIALDKLDNSLWLCSLVAIGIAVLGTITSLLVRHIRTVTQEI